jgi:hypothetical protein
MRKLAFGIFLVEAALLLALIPAPRVDAGELIARALDASTPAAIELGAYTWIEECGLGVPLPPAPAPGDKLPRLLAGKRLDDSRTTALWELGPNGLAGLQTEFQPEGARFETPEKYPFRPRRHSTDVVARRSGISLSNGRRGVVMDWTTAGRAYALVITDSATDIAHRKMDELAREVVQIEGVEQACIAPLMYEGRYAYILKGWQRDGERLRRKTPQGWLSMRTFQVPLTDFENVGRLQFELEAKLDAGGFKRSAGLKPSIAGNEGFVGEYFGNDGFVQRIAYAKLDTGYAVALMQAPEALRNTLSDEMDSFTRSLQATGLEPGSSATPLFFSRVRNVRCLAWQDGRRVLWGALFDDGRQQPVIWRQEGVIWNIQVTQGGTMIREREGTVNSSRALNPLVDAELRAIDLTDKIEGDIDLQLTVNGERTTTRVTIR